jgi:hypothetical protein
MSRKLLEGTFHEEDEDDEEEDSGMAVIKFTSKYELDH